MSEPAIRSAMNAAQIFLNDTEERRRYINREMAIMDREAQMQYAAELGEKQGEERLAALISALLADGKQAYIAKAAADKGFRDKLYQEYHI